LKIAMVVVGAALVITGAVWVFQGIGTLKGSFMTGQSFWAWMGAVAILVGAPLLARGLRRTR
jgi:hypothetical protein